MFPFLHVQEGFTGLFGYIILYNFGVGLRLGLVISFVLIDVSYKLFMTQKIHF